MEGPRFSHHQLPLICVQGIGFVGSAMAIAVASACAPDGTRRYNVIAVDRDTPVGRARAAELASGCLAFPNSDDSLTKAHRAALEWGNLAATTDPSVFAHASVVVVDINLDAELGSEPPTVNLAPFEEAIRTLGRIIQPGCLVLVETTVPPGTCEKVVTPILRDCARQRGLPEDAFLVAHSYERVMPGAAYLDSIIRYWRVYSGIDERSATACESFLSSIIDTSQYPLSRVASTTASEMGKVMENSYRAVTIAFVEEWSRLAEAVDVDLFTVIDAIRVRPTHSNFRQPGFGVGGYCLTKDPLFGGVAARQLLKLPDLKFPFSELAVAVNRVMPLQTLRLVQQGLGGTLKDKRLLLLGVSYRSDVGDTRHAPSATFVKAATEQGALLTCFDPLVPYWPEMELRLPNSLPAPSGFDAVIFTSNHPLFTQLDLHEWLGTARPLIVDGNRVLTEIQIQALRTWNVPFLSIGRGHTL